LSDGENKERATACVRYVLLFATANLSDDLLRLQVRTFM